MGVAGKCGRKAKYGKGVKTKTISVRVPEKLHAKIRNFLIEMVELEIEKENGRANEENQG